MKDELQGSITSERTKWGAPVLFSGCIQSILSPNDGTSGRRHPQLGCIMKTSFPFARSILSGLAGFFCRSRTRFDSFFKFPFFCLFFMFLYFQLCAVCELYVSRSDSVSAGILPSGTRHVRSLQPMSCNWSMWNLNQIVFSTTDNNRGLLMSDK